MKPGALLALPLMLALLAGCVSEDPVADDTAVEAPSYMPRAIVAVPDTGINPYHELYHRPGMTAHPCTYLEGFPCDVERLPLSVGGDDWEAAFEADAELWASLEPGEWYWIPETVFVAVSCEAERPYGGEHCFLDDGHMHGTGTTSSVIMESPDTLIAFKAGGSGVEAFFSAGIPVDIVSVSWGTTVPVPVRIFESDVGSAPIYVKAAGNDPYSSLMDSWSGDSRLISVGGAYAEDRSEEPMATKQPDIVSYYCRPTAQTMETHAMRESYCGTSFAAPTAAGALSKVILGLRQHSGHTGGIEGGFVDPALGVTVQDLRDALNRTASYDPEPQYGNTRASLPLNPVAPWVQWGWGFYDGRVADATLEHLLGAEAPGKPAEAVLWMGLQHDAKKALHG